MSQPQIQPQHLDEPRRWFNTQQAAEYAGRHIDYVRRALITGALEGHQSKPGTPAAPGRRQRRGGDWRISRDALDAWVEGRNVEALPNRVTRRAASRRAHVVPT